MLYLLSFNSVACQAPGWSTPSNRVHSIKVRHRRGIHTIHSHVCWQSSVINIPFGITKRVPVRISAPYALYGHSLSVAHCGNSTGSFRPAQAREDSTASEVLDEDDTAPGSKPKNIRTAYRKVIPLSHTAHSDLTGHFPIKAASGAE